MKKQKVLLIAYNNLGKGGIQNQIMGIVRSLKDKVDFDIVVWDDVKDYYTPALEQYSVKILRCFRSQGKSILRRKADAFIRYGDVQKIIKNVIREHGPYDAIHCNNAYDTAPCLEAAYKCGVPIRISHAHNMENPTMQKKRVYPAYKALYKHHREKILRYATHKIACSRQVADYFFGDGLGQVVHIGVDLSKFQNNQRCTNPTGKLRLLHVGSMCEQKNQLFLVDIMEKLIKLNADAHLTMIGTGTSYFSRVMNKIAEKGLEQYISVLAPDSDVPKAMAEADLFVFPSTFEGFGIVLIEAQAAGLRCLASDIVSSEANCGGIRYLPLEKGAEFWAETIVKCTDTSAYAEQYDVSEFSVENMSRNIYKIYSRLN